MVEAPLEYPYRFGNVSPGAFQSPESTKEMDAKLECPFESNWLYPLQVGKNDRTHGTDFAKSTISLRD